MHATRCPGSQGCIFLPIPDTRHQVSGKEKNENVCTFLRYFTSFNVLKKIVVKIYTPVSSPKPSGLLVKPEACTMRLLHWFYKLSVKFFDRSMWLIGRVDWSVISSKDRVADQMNRSLTAPSHGIGINHAFHSYSNWRKYSDFAFIFFKKPI